MDACFDHPNCSGCPGRVVCHCLQVTEDAVRDAVVALELRTVKDIRQHTGAGDGCTACHRRLRKIVEVVASERVLQPSSSPI